MSNLETVFSDCEPPFGNPDFREDGPWLFLPQTFLFDFLHGLPPVFYHPVWQWTCGEDTIIDGCQMRCPIFSNVGNA